MDKMICPNCGAAIEAKEPKCPFCGYINFPGAEEKFMRDLEHTEEQLSQIPEQQKEQIKKSIFKSSKVIWITILIVVLIAVLIAVVLIGGHFAIESIIYDASEYDAKAEMIWERENYPLLDEMYAAGIMIESWSWKIICISLMKKRELITPFIIGSIINLLPYMPR